MDVADVSAHRRGAIARLRVTQQPGIFPDIMGDAVVAIGASGPQRAGRGRPQYGQIALSVPNLGGSRFQINKGGDTIYTFQVIEIRRLFLMKRITLRSLQNIAGYKNVIVGGHVLRLIRKPYYFPKGYQISLVYPFWTKFSLYEEIDVERVLKHPSALGLSSETDH